MSFVSCLKQRTFSLLRSLNSQVLKSSDVCQNNRICRRQQSSRRSFSSQTGDRDGSHGMHGYRPSEFDKKILVYNKTYPTVDAVPKEISRTQMLNARDWFRVRMNIAAVVVTVVACVGVAFMGKRAAKQGKSIQRDNLEMHRLAREESNKK